jgi:hypothetical protein
VEGAEAMAVTVVPKPGDKYVWSIPGVAFGPIYMTVRKVIRGAQPRVIFDCVGPDGRPFRRSRRQYLPLPANVRRQDWTEQDIQNRTEEKQ